MTTDAFEQSRPTRTSARKGALAGITPVAMFFAWIAMTGWSGTSADLIRATVAIASVSVLTGWIVGARSRGSIRHTVVAVLAYPALAWLVMLPIGAIVSTTPWGVLYGLVASLYVIPLLTPFGLGWSLTYYALRRVTGG